jgi:hypothetical protein
VQSFSNWMVMVWFGSASGSATAVAAIAADKQDAMSHAGGRIDIDGACDAAA